MKTNKILLSAVVISALTIVSCKKDDTSSPSVAMNGPALITLDLHQAYVEQGASASDSKDGDLTSSISMSGAVDVNNAGVYTIDYSVSDKAGNTGEARRTVVVRHTAETTEGTFAVKDSCGNSSTSYVEVLNDEATTKLRVTRFANYDNANAYFEISGETNSTITVPQQTIVCGTVPVARVFTGTGSISPNGKKMTINYTEVTNNTSTSCTGIYSK